MAKDTIDTTNKFMVGITGDGLIHLVLPVPSLLSREDALNLAAYLVALADNNAGDVGGTFDRFLAAILDT